MLRSYLVAEGSRLCQITGENNRAKVINRLTGYRSTRQLLKLGFQLLGHLTAKGFISGNQDRSGQFVVFSLGQQIGGNMRRVAAAVVDHQNFTRPGDHIDINRAEDQALGRSDVNIARPGNLIDPWDGCRTIGQSGHGLGSTELENPIDSGNMGCRQNVRVDHTIRHWYHHDDLTNSGDLGRHRIHQH